MTDALLILPVVIPLAGAALSLVFWQRKLAHQLIALGSSGSLLALSLVLLEKVSDDGIQATSFGDWPAPVGIVFVADLLSAIMLCLTGIIGVAVVIYSLGDIDERRARLGYYPLLLVLLGGVSGAFLTGDFFNLYVWFEVMLMSSFVLLAIGAERAQLEGALKYVALNILASVFFLAGLGLLYSIAGTLNFADLAVHFSDPSTNGGLTTTVGMVFMVAFGIKAAMFPFFFWLPASYHTPPVPVSAVFAGLLTKVGVYALIRVFTLVFINDVSYTHTIILVLSGLTMAIGVLGAVAQNEFRRILSFHIISQIGYMTMGLGLFTPLGIAGSIFYIAHHIIVKANLFLVSGLVYRMRLSFDLKQLGGMNQFVLVSLVFLVPAMSLAGIPPLSGFFAKLALVRSGIEAEEYAIVGVALAVGFFTLFSMVKIWNEAFAKAPEAPEVPGTAPPWSMIGPTVVLAILTVGIGIGAGWLMDLSIRASEQLLQPAEYIETVLGERGTP